MRAVPLSREILSFTTSFRPPAPKRPVQKIRNTGHRERKHQDGDGVIHALNEAVQYSRVGVQCVHTVAPSPDPRSHTQAIEKRKSPPRHQHTAGNNAVELSRAVEKSAEQ